MKRRLCTLVAMCIVTAQLLDAQSIRWLDTMGEPPLPKKPRAFYATVVLDEFAGNTLAMQGSIHNLTEVPPTETFVRLSGFLNISTSDHYSISIKWQTSFGTAPIFGVNGDYGLRRETLVLDGAKDSLSNQYVLAGSANFRPAFYIGNHPAYPTPNFINLPSGYASGRALGISHDARYIVGFLSDINRSTAVPFYCIRQSNTTTALQLPAGYPRGIAVDVSNTGVIVGEAYPPNSTTGVPVRWQNNTSSPQIMSLPSGYNRAKVLRISNDGANALGIAYSNSGAAVVLWNFTSPNTIYTTTNSQVEADMNPMGNTVYILDNRILYRGNPFTPQFIADYSSLYERMSGLRLSSTTGRTGGIVLLRQGKLYYGNISVDFSAISDVETYSSAYPTAISSDGKFMTVEERFNLDNTIARSYVVDTNYDNSDTARGVEIHPDGCYAWDISDGGRYNHRVIVGAYNYSESYKPLVFEVTSPPIQLTRIPTDAPPIVMLPPTSISADGTVFLARGRGINDSYLWVYDGSNSIYRISSPFTNIRFDELSGNGRYVVGADINQGGRMLIYDRQNNSSSTHSVTSNYFYVTNDRRAVFTDNSGNIVVWNQTSSTTYSNYTMFPFNYVSADGRWIISRYVQGSTRYGALIDTQTNTAYRLDTHFSSILCSRCSLDFPAAISRNGRYIVGVGTKDGMPTFYLLDTIGCQPHDGDVDNNRCVDDADLLAILFNFGSTGSSLGRVDVNCDEVVDDADLLIVLFNFGSGC